VFYKGCGVGIFGLFISFTQNSICSRSLLGPVSASSVSQSSMDFMRAANTWNLYQETWEVQERLEALPSGILQSNWR
jgi:hypothetical protein